MNNRQCLLDSNFVIALMDEGDLHHKKAKELFEQIQNQDDPLIRGMLVLPHELGAGACLVIICLDS